MFSWQKIYKEIAQFLLKYRNRQSELIDCIKVMNKRGLKTVKVTDTDSKGKEIGLTVMDPFTFFANFNRRTTDSNRIEVLRYIKNTFSLKSDIPTGFEGLPVADPLNSWFFPYEKERTGNEIDLLWELYERVVKDPGHIDGNLFDKCLNIKKVGLTKLTAALFWIDPESFVSTDKVNISYLENNYNISMPDPSWETYENFQSLVQKKVGTDFVDISYKAWQESQKKKVVTREENQVINEESLIIIGTWKNFENSFDNLLNAIQKNNAWPSWWSFKIKDEAKLLLGKSFYLYLNSGKNNISYRALVTEFSTGYSSGHKCPWPEIEDEDTKGKVRLSENKNTVFRTWLKISNFEQLPKPLHVEDFIAADGLSKESSLLNQSTFGYAYLKKPKSEEYFENINSANNLILYGPPGTGKTFYLQDKLIPKFTDTQLYQTKDEFISESVKDLSWWQVLALVMLDFETTKVTAIQNHPVMNAKIQQSSAKNSRASIWGVLQGHTKVECEHVKFARRTEPLLFEKDEKSNWSMDMELVKADCPELLELKSQIDNYTPKLTIEKRYEFVTFHQSYSYEEFVEGIRPVLDDSEDDNELQYTIEEGVFKRMVRRAKAQPDKPFAIFMDEINRGNLSNIFGELITLIELDKRTGVGNPLELELTLPYSKESFGVPGNLSIIGTMNTADRSIAFMDAALRRRFEFEEITSNYKVVEDLVDKKANYKVSELLKCINQRIEYLFDRDHIIGHSYFLKCTNIEEIRNVLLKKIIPLLQEYFYDNWEKLCQILGCKTESSEKALNIFIEKKFEYVNFSDEYEYDDRKSYEINGAFKDASGPDLVAFLNRISE